ncbi:hypothetical protein [Janthinobacterium sp. HLX7-2]|uniref:hypothetical protein n=1 Tax=Janthinobacterium sp. HLX7-2 TaxID=1259331 RepID=UPI003F28DB7E
MMSKLITTARAALLMAVIHAGMANAQHVNPKQDIVDAAKDETTLNEAIAAKNKSEATLAASEFPAFPDGFGKAGTVTVDAADRDKFHVTARTAESFKKAAQALAATLPAAKAGKMSILLTDADRNAVAVYFKESQRIGAITKDMCALVNDKALIKPEAFGPELIGVGSLLNEIAQFAKLFRTDKSISFTSTDLADDILFDLLAVAASDKLIYPAGGIDALLDGSYATEFAKAVRTMTQCRAAPPKAPITSDKDKATVAAVDALATELASADTVTRQPILLSALRGELVQNSLASANAFLSVKVAAKGGASLKTSSIWRSDRLYAAGGVVVAYRLTEKGDPGQGNVIVPKVLIADVITQETEFVQVPLGK